MKLMHDLVGATLGDRYKLIVRLAGGGMGEVYKGHDLLLDRPVAVKVLQPALASDPVLVERFKAEARAAARLAHPNVVGVYDWGAEDDRTYFMVMEYVAGTDLRDLLVTRGSLEPVQAAEVVAFICDALAAAHSCGLVHRDVKPENVLIARGGAVKVADFGIAIVADIDRTLPGGGIAGTLRYLAPEQADGHDASPASDVWAAGAVLSELLTGLPPLQGAGAGFLRRRASEAPTPPSELEPRVPPELDEIVLKACAVEPRDRYRDASEMAVALRRVAVRSLPDAPALRALLDDVTGEIDLRDPVPTRLERRRRRGWRRRLKIVVVALALLAALSAGAVAVADRLLPGAARVPDLAGLSRGEAELRAAAAGFELVVTDRQHHFGTRSGEVVAQEPAPGASPHGDSVTVILSDGPPPVEVPNLVGLRLDEATQLVDLRGLELARVDDRYSARPEGFVLAQTPAQGEMLPGQGLRLAVSKGPRPVAVPSLEGMPLARARARLLRAGFEVVVDRAHSERIPVGRVVATTPAAGEITPAGSDVTVVASAGPRLARLELPDVRSLSAARARARLRSLGLRVETVAVEGCSGATVAETDPIPGTTVREKDLVALFLC